MRAGAPADGALVAARFAPGDEGDLDGARFVLTGALARRGPGGARWTEWRLVVPGDTTPRWLVDAPERLVLYDRPLPLAWLDAWIAGGLAATPLGGDPGDAAAPASVVGDVPAAERVREPCRELVTRDGTFLAFSARPDGARVRAGRAVRPEALGLTTRTPRPLVPHGPRPAGAAAGVGPGDAGALLGAAMRVRGGLSRASATGTWTEHLLEDARGELAWLVEHDGAFALARPLAADRIVDAAGRLGGTPCEAVTLLAAWGDLPFDAEPGTIALVRSRDDAGAEETLVEERVDEARAFTALVPVATLDVQRAFPGRSLPRPPGARRPRA